MVGARSSHWGRSARWLRSVTCRAPRTHSCGFSPELAPVCGRSTYDRGTATSFMRRIDGSSRMSSGVNVVLVDAVAATRRFLRELNEQPFPTLLLAASIIFVGFIYPTFCGSGKGSEGGVAFPDIV